MMNEIDSEFFEQPDGNKSVQDSYDVFLQQITNWLAEHVNMHVDNESIFHLQTLLSDKPVSAILYLMEYILGIMMKSNQQETIAQQIISLNQ